MLPLIPRAVPEGMEGGWVEPKLQLAAHVAAQCPVVVEITFPQWHMEPPPMEIWRKRQNTPGEESLTVTRRLTSHEKRAKATIRKYGWCFGIGQQRVIASAQFRLANDVEGPLQCHSLVVRDPCRFEFQITQFESYAKLGGRSASRGTQTLDPKRTPLN